MIVIKTINCWLAAREIFGWLARKTNPGPPSRLTGLEVARHGLLLRPRLNITFEETMPSPSSEFMLSVRGFEIITRAEIARFRLAKVCPVAKQN
jgi:hypothetical protein